MAAPLVVGDHDHRRAVVPVEAPEDLHDLVAHLGVQVAGRLVGQEQLRTPHDRARDGHPLLLPPRELGREVVHARGEAHALEGGEGQAPALGAGEAAVDEGQLHVVEHAQVVDQVEGLCPTPKAL
jgi:hypothetical protein